jgi:hypothetical protein
MPLNYWVLLLNISLDHFHDRNDPSTDYLSQKRAGDIGKVRYMNDRSLRRKFRIDSYVSAVNNLVS